MNANNKDINEFKFFFLKYYACSLNCNQYIKNSVILKGLQGNK